MIDVYAIGAAALAFSLFEVVRICITQPTTGPQ
jgi:hypothetical protein